MLPYQTILITLSLRVNKEGTRRQTITCITDIALTRLRGGEKIQWKTNRKKWNIHLKQILLILFITLRYIVIDGWLNLINIHGNSTWYCIFYDIFYVYRLLILCTY